MKSRKQKRVKCQLGDIVAIPLLKSKFAYARIFKDHDFAVYKFVSKKVEPVKKVTKHKIAFFQSATDQAVRSGKWPIIGNQPFKNDDEAWAPPKAQGELPNNPAIYHKGVFKRVKLEEVLGLEYSGMCWNPELFVSVLIDRLIKGNNSKYKVTKNKKFKDYFN